MLVERRASAKAVLAIAATAALVVFLLGSPRAGAQPPRRVLLLWSAQGGALARELRARAAGEAVAAGFSVDPVEIDMDPDRTLAARISLDETDTTFPSIAVLSSGDDAIVEVRLGRRLVHRSIVSRAAAAEMESERLLAATAVRAVAALQAASLESSHVGPPAVAPTRSIPAPRPGLAGEVRATTETSPDISIPDAGGHRRLSLTVGGAVLQTPGSLGPVLLPSLRAGYGMLKGFGIDLRLAGLGTSTSRAATAGSVRITQGYLLLGGTLAFRRGARLVPLIGVGAGAYTLAFEGNGSAPYIGKSERFWGLAASTGAALRVDLHPRLSAIVQLDVLWVWPQPVVYLGPSEVGRAGGPALSYGAGVMVWL
jgi:hypothetical protein